MISAALLPPIFCCLQYKRGLIPSLSKPQILSLAVWKTWGVGKAGYKAIQKQVVGEGVETWEDHMQCWTWFDFALHCSAIILYDRPAGMFHPTTVEERHKVCNWLGGSRHTIMALLFHSPKSKSIFTSRELLEHVPFIFVVNFDLLPRVHVWRN